jgi:hypothetical protein
VTSIYKQRPGTNPPILDAVIITGLGGLFAIGGLAVLVLNLIGSEGRDMMATILCLGSVSLGGGVLAAIGVVMIRRETAVIDYHVTRTALERHRNNKLIKASPYSAFTAARMIQSQRVIRRARPQIAIYPAIILQGDFEDMELAVSYGDFVAEYDVRAILQDLLPRLPESAAVEPSVRTFTETGDIPDLATLPEG